MASIDYTSRDFDSLVVDLRRRMAEAVPEWTGYDQGFETLLFENYAYVGDILNFYIDRMMNEAFLGSAALRESVLNIAQMFGYKPAQQTSAMCTLTFTKTPGLNENVTIPKGKRVFAQVEGADPIFFETTADLTIVAANDSGTVTATEGTSVTESYVGVSTGAEQQAMVLYYPRVIKDSVRVFTKDGTIDPATGQPTLVEWAPFERLIDANFYDRAFTTFVDEQQYTYIIFGDGVSGQIPAVNVEVYATYKHGVGAAGNIGVGAVKGFFEADDITSKFASVTNTTSAVGGSDPETIEEMRRSIPRSLRSLERAVTVQDYADIAMQVAGVGLSNAAALVSTNVSLYIAPVGGWQVDGTGADGQPSTNLLNIVQAYVDRRKMIGTSVTISGPVYVPINITFSVTVNGGYLRTRVQESVIAAVRQHLAFSNRKFGEIIGKAAVFRAVVDVPGVDYVTITAFNRDGAGDDGDLTMAANEIAKIGTITVNATGGLVVN